MGERTWYAASTLAFGVSAAATISMGRSMPEVDCFGIAGRSASMAWLRMPGMGWAEAVASFAVMWTVMMVAMMLPSLVPLLPRLGGSGARRLAMACGYFGVWAVAGLAVYPLGVLAVAASLQMPVFAGLSPMLTGAVVMLAGLFQFSCWKTRHLTWCRQVQPVRAGWRAGMQLGLHCVGSCANLVAVLLVVGVMDLWAMAAMTAAITWERLTGERAAHAVGALLMAAATVLVVWVSVPAVR
ncbi:MAG: DUF2182 domain-containing protein [Burkholderiales bacterium]|nr:DUF2182 domain-containing protein [Burkholderiales bacterium]